MSLVACWRGERKWLHTAILRAATVPLAHTGEWGRALGRSRSIPAEWMRAARLRARGVGVVFSPGHRRGAPGHPLPVWRGASWKVGSNSHRAAMLGRVRRVVD